MGTQISAIHCGHGTNIYAIAPGDSDGRGKVPDREPVYLQIRDCGYRGEVSKACEIMREHHVSLMDMTQAYAEGQRLSGFARRSQAATQRNRAEMRIEL
jgi:RNA polymerase-interacting CarD/CdnL/TRCF family regulator